MPRSREDTYLVALQKARTDLQKLDPYRVAFLAGCTFTDRPQAKLILPFFGADYVVSFPDLFHFSINEDGHLISQEVGFLEVMGNT